MGINLFHYYNTGYEDYNQHPDHIALVQTYWINEVKDFLEKESIPTQLL